MSSTYIKSGKGSPVMLVHGYGENKQVWSAILKHLPKKFQYLMPDLPGFGEQEVVDPVSMSYFADYLNNILIREKIKKVCLLGHSMGGYIAMAFAEKYPEKLNAIGLLHSHVFADTPEQIPARKKAIEFIQRNGASNYLKDFVKNLFAGATNKKIIERHLKTIAETPPKGLTSSLQAMIERNDTSATLKNVDFPVLFIFGRQDKLMPLEKVLKQCELPARSMVEILENAGHQGMLEEPKKFAKAVGDFLEWGMK